MAKPNLRQRHAPPAGWPTNTPLPPGKLIVSKLLPEEEAMLRQHGWQPGQPIPENIAELLNLQPATQATIDRIQREATDVNMMPAPVALTTPPVTYRERDINELPPEEAERYQTVAAAALRQMAEMEATAKDIPQQAGPGIAAAIRAASQPVVQDDTADSRYDTGFNKRPAATPQPPTATEPPTTTPHFCSRCGFPTNVTDPVVLTEEDKANYVQSLLGGVSFTKAYSRLRNQLRLRVRELTTEELNLISLQLAAKRKQGIAVADESELGIRYRTCLQLVELSGFGSLPKTLAEWRQIIKPERDSELVAAVLEMFEQQVATNESIYRMLVSTVSEFNQLVRKLEAVSLNPDF